MHRLKLAVLGAALATSFLALPSIVLPASAQVGAADAASLEGDWSGALDVQGFQLRLVLHVTNAGGKTAATLDSLDQGAMAIPVSTIGRSADKMTFAIAAINGSYEGALSADGKTVTGTWTQGENALPLTLKRP